MEQLHRIVVSPNEFMDDPHGYGNVKLWIREHRRYRYPDDFGLNRLDEEEFEERMEELRKEYHVFFLDCYEHSGVAFSFSGTGTQCLFDTATKVGAVFVDKNRSLADADDTATEFLKEWNSYLNGAGVIVTHEIGTPYKKPSGEEDVEWLTEDFADFYDGIDAMEFAESEANRLGCKIVEE